MQMTAYLQAAASQSNVLRKSNSVPEISETAALSTVPVSEERVNIKASELELKRQIFDIARDMVSSWSNIGIDNVSLRAIPGGTTNALFLLTTSEPASNLVVRVFGEGSELFIDRRIENEVFCTLSANGIAPPVLGVFANGRIETFLSGRSLEWSELNHPLVSQKIATALGQFHGVDIHTAFGGDSVGIWAKGDQFLGLLLQGLQSAKKHSQHTRLLNLYSFYKDEWGNLRRYCSAPSFHTGVHYM